MSRRMSPELAVSLTDMDHTIGPTDAAVTIVEYGDFQCPTCKLAFPVVKLLLKRFGADVRFAYRHFPLEQPHPLAFTAAEAAECAAAQGRFWQMHDLLFESQPRLERINLDAYARMLDLDMPRFASELDTHAHLHKVRADLKSGEQSHLRGTPGFYVNGRIVDVSFGMQALLGAIEASLKDR